MEDVLGNVNSKWGMMVIIISVKILKKSIYVMENANSKIKEDVKFLVV